MHLNQNFDLDGPIAKRPRKSLHLTEILTKDISSFLFSLNSQSIIIPDKRPNTTIKDLENVIKAIYDVPSPECFLMNGDEYSGDRCLHELTREKYQYVPFQSSLDVEIKFFSLRNDELLVETLKSMKNDHMESIDRKVIDKIRYGVNIINFYKKKVQKSQHQSALQPIIPQILRGNTCDSANEEKIDELMRHRYKSPAVNIKQNILYFKQSIENELMINLDKVDVYDLYRFQKLPEQLPLSTFITMANDYTEFVLSFRFKQMPKINSICVVINQVTPIPSIKDDNATVPNPNILAKCPPKELILPSLDSTRIEKEQWIILDTFSHGCKKEDPQNWTSLEIGLWLNYIRTSLNIVPKDKDIRLYILNGAFCEIIQNKGRIAESFHPNSNSNEELIISRFIRHCELLLKYKLFYQFNQFVTKQTSRVCIANEPIPQPLRSKGPLGRSKARREDLVSKLGGRREIHLNSKNLMETKLGQSLYSGKNSTNATTVSQFQHRKWTFFLKCLVQPERAKDVAWIDYDGVFRLVDQEIIARLYGQTCHKPEMTYDKLSRGLRYDRSGLIDKADKNYCWKFTVPIEEILGLSVETIINKMYKYYKKSHTNYPADILLKESLAKKKTKPIGHMEPLIRDPMEVNQENRLEEMLENEYYEAYAKMGYMSTDRRINFWITPKNTTPERYEKRVQQGRLVHSVMPNEPEFISLIGFNNNKSVVESRQWIQDFCKLSPKIKDDPLLLDMGSRNRNDSLNLDSYNYMQVSSVNVPEVEVELEIDYFLDGENLDGLV